MLSILAESRASTHGYGKATLNIATDWFLDKQANVPHFEGGLFQATSYLYPYRRVQTLLMMT